MSDQSGHSQSEKAPDEPQPQPVQPQPVQTGSFHKGARFDPNKPVQIPPPPPGSQPTPVQIAVSQGQSIAIVNTTGGSSPYPAQPQPAQQGKENPPVHGTFDQGARFNPNQPAHIPPPPPGVQPTPAQIAASQGQTVVMVQEKKDKWTGASDAGAAW